MSPLNLLTILYLFLLILYIYYTIISSIIGLIRHWMLRFKDVDDNLDIVSFSSKKIKDLGFQYKYNLEDMYIGAVETCQNKGLLPKAAEERVVGTS